jgi:hypothetical protein
LRQKCGRGAEFSGGTVNFAGGFDVSHPPADVVLPTVMGPSPDSGGR